MTDAMLEAARGQSEMATSIDARMSTGGLATPAPLTDLTQIGEGRSKMLELKLARMSDNVSGQTVVDPKGYLTGLASSRMSSGADIGCALRCPGHG